MANTFIYPHLDRSTRSIRLLSFIPSHEKSETIRCALTTQDMSTCPPFVALSYTWGQSDLLTDRVIDLNGRAFTIRENLHTALSLLRSFSRNPQAWTREMARKNRNYQVWTPCFWIDAICINQDDLQERGHQVDLMHTIYSQAQIVMAWLGPSVPQLEPLNFSRLKLSDDSGFCWKRSPPAEAMLSSPYWSRMWVIQEFVTAQQLVLLSGNDGYCNYGCWWDDLVKYYMTFQSEISSEWPLASGLIELRHNFRLLEESHIVTSMTELLQMTRRAECQDVRDKVYALVALTPTPEPMSTFTSTSLGIQPSDATIEQGERLPQRLEIFERIAASRRRIAVSPVRPVKAESRVASSAFKADYTISPIHLYIRMLSYVGQLGARMSTFKEKWDLDTTGGTLRSLTKDLPTKYRHENWSFIPRNLANGQQTVHDRFVTNLRFALGITVAAEAAVFQSIFQCFSRGARMEDDHMSESVMVLMDHTRMVPLEYGAQETLDPFLDVDFEADTNEAYEAVGDDVQKTLGVDFEDNTPERLEPVGDDHHNEETHEADDTTNTSTNIFTVADDIPAAAEGIAVVAEDIPVHLPLFLDGRDPLLEPRVFFQPEWRRKPEAVGTVMPEPLVFVPAEWKMKPETVGTVMQSHLDLGNKQDWAIMTSINELRAWMYV